MEQLASSGSSLVTPSIIELVDGHYPTCPPTNLLKGYLKIADHETNPDIREKTTGKVLTLEPPQALRICRHARLRRIFHGDCLGVPVSPGPCVSESGNATDRHD